MAQGFFSKQETQLKTRPDGKSLTCYSCGLYKSCQSPKLEPFGNFKKGIMNIGEAPGLVEDRLGKPFQGKTGQLLQCTYKKFGVDLFDDCININSVNCRPSNDNGKNRSPTNFEVECCRKSIFSYIEQYKPKIIVLLGNLAIYSLLAHRWKKDLKGITEWRGWLIPDQELGCWVCPIFHPSYVERINTPEVTKVWEKDIYEIFTLINVRFPITKEPKITVIKDLSILNKIHEVTDTVAIDYETTGLKPHAKGHRIVMASVAINEDEAYVFEMPKEIEKREPFINLLKNKYIKKIAHNMKFEENWSFVRLKTRVRNWYWDTMIAAHLLDNRSGITGLKFQVYINFGIIDYSSHMDGWLDGVESKNANSLNRIREYIDTPNGKKEVMKYNAYDSVYTYRLAMKQIREFEILSLPF